MRMYDELAEWYHLLSDPSEHADEAQTWLELMRAACPDATTLLELGSGGGCNAFHLKRAFTCTLTDLSPQMLAVSAGINPECEHLVGDMRTLRLERQFDAVFVHDAIVYMTSIDDLRATLVSAYHHTRPGGVAVIVPDAVTETFVPTSESGGTDGPDGRGVRYVDWVHEPAGEAATYLVDYAFLVRDRDGTVRTVYDRHEEGLFPRATWRQLLADVGFTVDEPTINPLIHGSQVAFVCTRASTRRATSVGGASARGI